MGSESTEDPKARRRSGRSLRRIEIRWPSSREWDLTHDDGAHFRAHPLEYDERGVEIYQPPLTFGGRRGSP
jgi:hypothetical protein